jgi:hypothetical protein
MPTPLVFPGSTTVTVSWPMLRLSMLVSDGEAALFWGRWRRRVRVGSA